MKPTGNTTLGNNTKFIKLVQKYILLALASTATSTAMFQPPAKAADPCNGGKVAPYWIRTYQNTPAFRNATTKSPQVGTVPAGRYLSANEWHFGDDGNSVYDPSRRAYDARFNYVPAINAWVPGALVALDAPNSTATKPSYCNGQPAPSSNANTPFLPFDPGVSLTVETGYGGHGGQYGNFNRYAVDFGAAGKNVSARASRAGVVTRAGWDTGRGKFVEVRYNDGKHGNYQHLDAVYVSAGTRVAGGQWLGKIGNTGNSTGPHLHYMESDSSLGASVPLPQFADAPNANFNNVKSVVTSQNPDNRR
jgi:murein DD-endopeptidase MepM/ murein hydrolase activator NlpD